MLPKYTPTPLEDKADGIPLVDGTSKRPKHVLGKRKPNEYVRASKCISHKDGVSTIFTPTRTPAGNTRIVQNESGEWIIQKSTP